MRGSVAHLLAGCHWMMSLGVQIEVEAKDFEVGEVDADGFVIEDAPSDIVGEAPFYHGGEGFFDAAEFEHGGGID